MKISVKKQWIIFIIVNLLLLTGLCIFPTYYKYIMPLPNNDCFSVTFMGLYCPACGCTRATKALFDLDILGSLAYNPVMVMGAGFLAYYEGSFLFHLIKRKEREFLTDLWVSLPFFVIWLAYALIRNLLLIFGVDLLGMIL